MDDDEPERKPGPDVIGSTILRLGLLPWLRAREGSVHVFCPEWLYDLCVYFLFPVNWCIAAIAARLPCDYAAPDWPLDPELHPSKRPAPTRSLQELRDSIRRRDDALLEDADAWALFDWLPAPTANDMLGNWRGKVVLTGSWLDIAAVALERPLGWLGLEWGKRFLSPYKGDPFIIIVADKIIVPVPCWGNVSMPEINLRGKTGAAMTYDHQPWKDHFRVLDDGKAAGRRMMLGNWISREKNGGWFTLEELPEMNRAVSDLLQRSPY